jgi:hypothetical protein
MGKRVLTAYERTLEEGIGIGEMNTKLETARKMRDKGFSILEIQEFTGLSDEELNENGILKDLMCNTEYYLTPNLIVFYCHFNLPPLHYVILLHSREEEINRF